MNITKLMTQSLSSMLLVLLLVSQSAGALEQNNLDIGDQFTFTVSAGGSQEINGTQYFDTSENVENQLVEIEITNIEVASGFFFAGSDTYVNYTETVGEDVYQGSSFINDWQIYTLFVLFLFIIDETSLDFSEPEEEDIEEDEELISSFPYFATSNESYYREIDEESGGSATIDDGQGNRIATNIGYDDPNEIFTYNYEITTFQEGITDDGDDFEIDAGFNFEVTVDVARSILTHFTFELSIDATVGDATMVSELFLTVDEGTGGEEGGIFGLDFAPITILFISFATIALIARRKR